MNSNTTTEVNFHKYPSEQYDRDIRNSIPFHREIHEVMAVDIAKMWEREAPIDVLDLGCGTGLTSEAIRSVFPQSKLTLVDFSQHMLDGAKKKFPGDDKVTYCCEDYMQGDIATKRFNIIASCIGIHHQNDGNKVALFSKIHRGLEPVNGVFIFADLVTFRDPLVADAAYARHFQHLAEHAADEQTLAEWANHHRR